MAKFNIKKKFNDHYLDIKFEHHGDVTDVGLHDKDECLELIAELGDTIQFIASHWS